MSMSFSARRWTCLLTLAVVMLVCASQASFPPIAHECCHKTQDGRVPNIMKCYKQQYRGSCPYHAFLIESSSSSKRFCVHKDAEWLQKLLNKKKLTCGPQFTALGRFKLLDVEDDVEW